jgi:hypothetical protein
LLCLALGAALLAAASPATAKKAIPGSVSLNQDPVFSGKITASKACRSKRTVTLIDNTNGGKIAQTKSAPDGTYAITAPAQAPNFNNSYAGTAYARVAKKAAKGRKKALCKPLKSPPRLVGEADVNVGIDWGACTAGTCTYQFTVTNLGPGVSYNPGGAPSIQAFPHQTVPSVGAFPATCGPGTVPPSVFCRPAEIAVGAALKFTLSFGPCNPPSHSISVSFEGYTHDPVQANNRASLTTPCP